jgi:methionyl-tRNA synthetase
MVGKFSGGRAPVPDGPAPGHLRAGAASLFGDVDACMEHLAFSRALEAVWDVLRRCNRFIDDEKPWVLHKEGKSGRLGNTLYSLLETLRVVSWVLEPFIPAGAREIRRQLGVPDEKGLLHELMAWGRLGPGTPAAPGGPLFPKVQDGNC